jgi:hypothetical protein
MNDPFGALNTTPAASTDPNSPFGAFPSDTSLPTDPAAAPTDVGEASPLDLLEGILNDAKTVADANLESADDVAARLAAIHQKQEEQAVEDQAAISVQQQQLQAIQSTPEFQARIQQDEAARAEKEKHKEIMDDIEIGQLTHTTI